MEYSTSRTIHFHLFESRFMPSYNCWTSHGKQGVEMEEDEAEDGNIPDWAQYAAFEGNQMGEVDRDADDNDAADDLGLEVQKIHTCPNDCILYRGEECENLEACPVCKALRYKIRRDDLGEVDGQPTKKRIPAKVICNLSGQSNKGYKACTHCMDETESTYLKHCRKVVYMGHRRFLAANQLVWKKGKHFEYKADHRTKPKHYSGKTVFAMVKDLKVVFGKGPGSQPMKSEDGHAAMWKKNSIFWELPYWEFLDIRHAIDVMHLTKNICDQINWHAYTPKGKFWTCTGVKQISQASCCTSTDLHPEPKEKGSHYLSPASYTLSKAKKESMFECLESIKVPFGYSTNIKRIISTKEKKFTNLKSLDYHVLMTQLLPVIIRGILPNNVRATITKLCALMNAISQKIGILGPVYLRNMFPFERYMGVLKKYVRNRASPEASIAKGYGTDEVIEFCVEFIEDLRPIGVPESHHEGRLQGKGTLGRKAIMMVDNNLFRKAHFTVLQQSSLVAPYIEEHLALVRARNIAQDIKSTNQNSAVCIDAVGHDGTTGTYYGAIEDIWELDYGPLKVPLFRCQWVRLTGGGVMIDDSGMTTVDFNKVGYSDEPFVLANVVTQVFYVKDMSSKGKKGKGPNEPKRHVVLPRKRKIVGVEDKTDEDYDQFDEQPPFTAMIHPSILLSNKDTPYSRSDHKEGTLVRRKYVRSTVTADVLP
uniref:Transposon protein, putative, CACTA, En/Spm sub-class n=1 Tax=Oryza sativa subsp. japonica TaxID=39947 RepID=Q2QUY8_ORYSJ|nr:transposon protein, putative, CACTA, En/Spm sub-class [Oryza sativa Japonica Group]